MMVMIIIMMTMVLDEVFLTSIFSLFMRFLVWVPLIFFSFALLLMSRPLLDLRYVEHDDHVQQQQHDSWVFV